MPFVRRERHQRKRHRCGQRDHRSYRTVAASGAGTPASAGGVQGSITAVSSNVVALGSGAATGLADVSRVNVALAEAQGYVGAGDAATLSQAKAYADVKYAAMVTDAQFDSFRNQVSDQFHAVNQRLDRVGAMGTAMAQMAFSTQGINTDNRFGVGVGFGW